MCDAKKVVKKMKRVGDSKAANSAKSELVANDIRSRILTIRGVQVLLDRDLAYLYGVLTGNLNKAVKRNLERFPSDFMFQLTKEESLMFQNGISKDRRGGTRFAPYAFTENGIAMLSSVLRSERAIEVNIRIMREFVAMRKTFSSLAPSDVAAFNAQYAGLSIRTSVSFHDRFVIVDDKSLYLFGASLKDLGKKCFAFTKLDEAEIPGLKARTESERKA